MSTFDEMNITRIQQGTSSIMHDLNEGMR